MKRTPIRTLGSLGPQLGEAVRVDGFPGRCRTLHKLSARSTGYVGRLTIDATLSANPVEEDWRTISTIDFERGAETKAVNLVGKFVWLRASIDDALSGDVDTVMVR